MKLTDDIIGRIGKASNRIDKVVKELSTVLNEKDPSPSDYRLLSLDRIIKETKELLKTELSAHHIKIVQNHEFKKIKMMGF